MTLESVKKRAVQLAKLIESSTFDGERANAIDAYFRLCDEHGLNPQTLQPEDKSEAKETLERLLRQQRAAQIVFSRGYDA